MKCLWDWIGANSDEVIAIASVVTAFGALIFGWFQLRINKKLYRAQVPVPLLMREGVIEFNQLTQYINGYSTNAVVFRNHKEIALKITGYAIVNGRRHELFWNNSANTSTRQEGNREVVVRGMSTSWDWLGVDGTVGAFLEENGTLSSEQNQIVVTYYDYEGNRYQSIMGSDYHTKIKRMGEGV